MSELDYNYLPPAEQPVYDGNGRLINFNNQHGEGRGFERTSRPLEHIPLAQEGDPLSPSDYVDWSGIN